MRVVSSLVVAVAVVASLERRVRARSGEGERSRRENITGSDAWRLSIVTEYNRDDEDEGAGVRDAASRSEGMSVVEKYSREKRYSPSCVDSSVSGPV